ncbi:catalase family protein [Sphingomonas montana]|uniref:catalase family protein n=1 Tax=Sphingomonas montana TaxID=1843236 RepID=UPI00096E8A31|nr:catalase family protein [Sphingomonas montana]
MPKPPIPYDFTLETVAPDEAETHAELARTLMGIVHTVNDDHGHAYRSVHAKSHALLEATFEVVENLPTELAQGLFGTAKSYPAVVRISTNAGDPLPDTISLPRGMAVKVIGVDGARLPGSEGDSVQDFVMANGKAFAAKDAKAFLKNLKLLAATTDKAEWGKKAISAVFRTAERALEAVGTESAFLKTMGGYPNSHPLGESYFSQVPLRFGDYVAKIGVFPASQSFTALEGKEITIGGRDDAIREEMNRVLAATGGVWEMKVQLMRDPATNPVEDATVVWPEEDNPYLTVARIRIAPQTAWSEPRAETGDDRLSFAPWNGLAAHQPLGGIMRARKLPYEKSAELRGQLNGCPIHQPHAAVNLPD